jgi:hypothetical protein
MYGYTQVYVSSISAIEFVLGKILALTIVGLAEAIPLLIALTIRECLEHALRRTVDFLSTPGNPNGCLSVHGALATGPEGDPVKQWLIQGRKQGEAMVKRRFEQAKEAGELPADTDPGAYARYLETLIQGLGVQGASGATKAEMNKMVDLALKFMGY